MIDKMSAVKHFFFFYPGSNHQVFVAFTLGLSDMQQPVTFLSGWKGETNLEQNLPEG